MKPLTYDKEYYRILKEAVNQSEEDEQSYKVTLEASNTFTANFRLLQPDFEETPERYPIHSSGENYASTCFSTYPNVNGVKFGKPIADTHAIEVFDNYLITSLADGCGMGQLPAKASRIASEKFKEFLMFDLIGKKQPKQVIDSMLKAIAYVQTELVGSGNDIVSSGLTTFLGCVIYKIKDEPDKYAVAYVNIGDCRGVMLRPKNDLCWELVSGYTSRVDVTDAGGRLGPADGHNMDLGVFSYGVHICMAGDILLLMTDGVYDNFDPNVLGKPPTEYGLNEAEWSDSIPEHRKKRNEIFYSLLKELYKQPNAAHLVRSIYGFVVDKTAGARQQKIENDVTRSPFNVIPGKMDHSSIAVMVLCDDIFHMNCVEEEDLEIPADML